MPTAAGLNVTVMVQEAPAATLMSQVLVSVNFVGFVPANVMPEMSSAALPVLVSVVKLDLLNPDFTVPKFRLVGASCTVPAVSVTAAPLNFVVSATDVAVTVTAGSAGKLAGAV